MSALVIQPSWQVEPARPSWHQPVPAPARSTRRGPLQLVGPGFVPVPASAPSAVDHRASAGRVSAPLRLTVRGRRLVAVLGRVAATVVSVGVGTWLGAALSAPPAGEVVTVTVAPGQTLWALAGAAAAPGEDVREVVAQIAALNGLADADVRPGQALVVPAG